jgi:hypothetical protein
MTSTEAIPIESHKKLVSHPLLAGASAGIEARGAEPSRALKRSCSNGGAEPWDLRSSATRFHEKAVFVKADVAAH